MAVKEAIDVLKNINCKHEDKEAAYANLISNLKNTTTEDELKTQGTQLLKLLCRDLLDKDENIIQSALHVVHFCLGSEHFGSLQKSDSELTLKSLIHCSHKASSVGVIKLILDCFSVQRFDQDVLSTEILVFFTCLEELNTKIKAHSVFVVEKQVKIFARLKEQIEKKLKQSAPRWARLVFPGLGNSSQDVREMALSLLEHFREDLCGSQDLSRLIIKALNSGLAESLKALMLTQESYVLKAWSLIVLVTGQGLHKGSTINLLLEIAEIGFKGSHVGRHNAFIAWRSLIDNFALDKARLLDAKRIKLLLMVLKIDNAKVEHVAIQKLHTWWHLCSCIGTKLAVNFEMIVHPLLQFCVGNGKLNNASDMGQSSKLALKTSVINTSSGPHSSSNVINNMPVFPVVQKLSCEVIARLVSKIDISDDPGNVTWTIGALSDEVLGSPAIFVKHAPIIMTALQTVLLSVGKEIEENLVLHIWISLGNHLKVAMESSVKTECRDIFSSYLNILHSMTQNQVLQTQTILRMIEICCSFPQKVLASTAYNIAGGQPVRGCPALLLNEVLLTSYVIENTSGQENFIKLFSTLVNAGASNVQGALLYLQTVTEMLDLQALSVTSPELLWKMWSSLAHTLQDTINTTNEVNQGDALEYNFTCMYTVLLLPVKHHLSSKVSQAVSKTLLKTWKELYHSFARLSALVATAEANSCLEEMCAKILENWNTKPQDPVNLELMSNLCHKMLECVDFSAVSVSQNPGGGLTLSPSKWVRRRQRPMGNLHSFVHLLATLQTELNLFLSTFEDSEIGKKQDFTRTVISIAHILVEVYIKLFAHITSSNVVSNCLMLLASPLATLYQPNTKSGYGKLFVPFSTKLEKLWQEIAQCIISRYNGLYDSDFLKHLSPLLDVTFEHKRRPIKNQSLTLWNTTFGRTSALEYPSQLKQILIRIKMEKNTIILPGLNTSNQASVVAETPFSEMSMGDSQVPIPVLPQLASPKRQKGSLLNRDLSPATKLSPKASPAKIVSPKEARCLLSGTRKRIELDFLPIESFVRIDSPATKKKRLLTDHQKEVLKQKCVLPAMYNNIDTSQDISLMSQFGTETQQSMSSADVIVVNSSESQEVTHETPKGATYSKSLLENDNYETLYHSASASLKRRRSVRIQESQNSNIEVITKDINPLDELAVITGTDLDQKSDSVGQNTEDSERNIISSAVKEQNSESLFKSIPSEGCIDTSISVDGTTDNQMPVCDQKNMDSPFLMFRTKQQAGCKTNLTQNSIDTKPQRKIVTRQIRSQNDIPLTKVKEEIELLEKTVRTPRRVPLKKITDQEYELDSDRFSEKTSSGVKSHGSSLTCSSKLSSLMTFSKDYDGVRAEQPTDVTNSAQEQDKTADSDSSVDVSCMLVEDTQSPFKLKQHAKETDHSIAETPLKSESSNSPPLRVASARKLFTDCETTSISETPIEDSEQVVRSTVERDNKNEEKLLLVVSEITSSQGFEIVKDIQMTAEQNVTESSHTSSGQGYIEVDQCASDISSVIGPESENLFPSIQVSNFSMDMMMPTLSSSLENSQSVSQANNSDSSIHETQKTSSTASSELSNKQTSSSDSDFFCSQSTLVDEVLIQTANKRKRVIPKKLLPIKSKTNSKKTNIKVKKGIQASKKVDSSCHSKFEPVSESNSAKKDEKIKIPLSQSLSNQHIGVSTQLSIFSEDAPCDGKDSEIASTKVKALKEIGEVTPDMKSPRSNPERRHSSVKRMGKSSKRKLEKSNVSKPFASKKIKVDTVCSDNLERSGKIEGKNERVEGWKNKPKPVSPDVKRKRLMLSPNMLSQHKHLLKTRNKTFCKMSANDNSRSKKSLKPDLNNLSDSEDGIPLSSYIKKSEKDDIQKVHIVEENNMDMDDRPLSELIHSPVTVVEHSQKPDVRHSSNLDSSHLSCTEEQYLAFDSILSASLKEIELQCALDKATKKNNLPKYESKDTMVECSLSESLATDNSKDMKQDHVHPEEQILRTEDKDQETNEENNVSMLDDATNSNTAEDENIKVDETLIVCESSVTSCLNKDIHTDNPKCNNAGIMEISESVTSRLDEDIHTDNPKCNDAGIMEISESVTSCLNEDIHTDKPKCNDAVVMEISESVTSRLNEDIHTDKPKCNDAGIMEISESVTSRLNEDIHTDKPKCNDAVVMEISESVTSRLNEDIHTDKPKCNDAVVMEISESVASRLNEDIHTDKPKCNDAVVMEISESVTSRLNEECNDAVIVEISQSDIVLDECFHSEIVPVEITNAHLVDEISEQQKINKTCSDALNPHLEVNKEDTRGDIIDTGFQKGSARSPERNVKLVCDWSPTRSPSCSILKRCTEIPPSGKNMRVSFAEPIVSGESPVRECYKDFNSASPMISPQTSSPGQKGSLFNRCQGKVSKYRRRLESPKEPSRFLLCRKLVSPQSQLSYKPTQESQLNSFGPVFPELVDCPHPLDDILPQLTSSLWYRGLCQLMKGRNVNTIGDLSTLTEVQINQLPIRNPKVESVKSTLNNYMIQHGLVKVISCVEDMQDSNKSSRSKGSTIEQEITPSSIDDEGIQIQPEADKDLKQLSPIKEADAEPPKLSPLLLYMKEANNSSPATTEDETTGDATPRDERPLQMSSCLKDTVKQYSPSNLKKASLSELFDIQQTLNLLSTNLIEEMKSLNLLFKNVVEEMKSRHSST